MRKKLLHHRTLKIIEQDPLSENLSMDVSKSECNIVHKTLSQNNSSDVPTNVITELKDDEHIKPSVNDKGSIYFNIFECCKNLLDQLDVTYQWAFTASPVQHGLYQIYTARERYYDMMANNIVKTNVGSEVTINDKELRKAITILKSEEEAGHERNIDITASPVQHGLYQIYTARERYYDMMADNIEEMNVGSEGNINKEELCKAINIVKSE